MFLTSHILNIKNKDKVLWYGPDYCNNRLFGFSEELDDLLDPWSGCAGADETTDSSSTLTFGGGCFIGSHVYGIFGLMPTCINPCSDTNSILMCCEDSVLGTVASLVLIIGYRVFSEALLKDSALSTISFMVSMESSTQWQRALQRRIYFKGRDFLVSSFRELKLRPQSKETRQPQQRIICWNVEVGRKPFFYSVLFLNAKPVGVHKNRSFRSRLFYYNLKKFIFIGHSYYFLVGWLQ